MELTRVKSLPMRAGRPLRHSLRILSPKTRRISSEAGKIAYFTAMHDFKRNVLGRKGWLQQMRIGIIDYDGKLYLSAYDDEA
jgi:hypothetical protein